MRRKDFFMSLDRLNKSQHLFLVVVTIGFSITLVSYGMPMILQKGDIPTGCDTLRHLLIIHNVNIGLVVPEIDYGNIVLSPTLFLIKHFSLILFKFGIAYSFLLLIIILFCTGIIGMFFYLHHGIGLNRFISLLLSTIIYVANHGIIIWVYHGILQYLMGYSLLPWLLYGISSFKKKLELLVRNPNNTDISRVSRLLKTHAIALALLTYVFLTLSHIHMIITSSPLILSLFILDIYNIVKHNRQRIYIVAKYIVQYLIAVLILLIPYIAYLHLILSGLSSHYGEKLYYKELRSIAWHASPPTYAFALAEPTIFPISNNCIFLWLIAISITIVSFLLTLRGKQLMRDRILLVMFLAYLSMSMGLYVPYPFNMLNILLHRYVILYRIVGGPFRYLAMAAFTFSLILGITIERLTILYKRIIYRLIRIVMVILILCSSTSTLSFVLSSINVWEIPISSPETIPLLKDNYIYVVPSYKRALPQGINVTKFYSGAWSRVTTKPWPQNPPAIILAMKGYHVVIRTPLSPWIYWLMEMRGTDLISVLFYYMHIGQVLLCYNVSIPPSVLFPHERYFMKKQQYMKAVYRDKGIELLYNILLTNLTKSVKCIGTEHTTSYLREYRDIALVMASPLHYTLLAFCNFDYWKNVFPLFLDENLCNYAEDIVNLTRIYILDGSASILDLVYALSLSYKDIAIFDYKYKAIDGKYNFLYPRSWWYYTTPLYSINDVIFMIRKGDKLKIRFSIEKSGEYIIMIRALGTRRNLRLFIKLDDIIHESLDYAKTQSPIPMPVWMTHVVSVSEGIHEVTIQSSHKLYIDTVVLLPYSLYKKLLLKVIDLLSRSEVYLTYLPWEVTCSEINKTQFKGIGFEAKGIIRIDSLKHLLELLRSEHVTNSSLFLLIDKDRIVSIPSNNYAGNTRDINSNYSVIEANINDLNTTYLISDGVLFMFLRSKPVNVTKSRALYVLVYYQRYHPGCVLKTRGIIYHVRGLYGICNVYLLYEKPKGCIKAYYLTENYNMISMVLSAAFSLHLILNILLLIRQKIIKIILT